MIQPARDATPVLIGRAQRWVAFLLCMISYLFCGVISSMMSVFLTLPAPELIKESLDNDQISKTLSWETGDYIGAFFLYGWVLGGLLFGFVGDNIGRVPTLALVTAITGLSTLLIVAVPDYESLLILRFVSGTGVGGVLLMSTVYISEIWNQKSRPVVLGILGVSFVIGSIVSSGMLIFFTEWRQPFQLGIIVIIVSILIYWLAPESSQWKQASHVSVEKRLRFLDRAFRMNVIIGALIFGSVHISLWGIFCWLPEWLQTLVPEGQEGNMESGYSMALMGAGGIVGGLVSGFFVKVFGGSRTLIATFSACILLCCLLFLTNDGLSSVVYLQMGILGVCFGISQGALSDYIPNLFPVAIRAAATGFCFNVGRFFTATAVFFIGSFVDIFGGFGNTLLVFSFPFAIALAASWYAGRQEKMADS